jgi:peptide/nickel transport system permease protein
MADFLLRRVVMAIFVLVPVSMLSFGLLKLSGDLATSLTGEFSSADYAAFLRHEYGLDAPLPVQYVRWLGHTLGGDFGKSFYSKRPVMEILAEGLPVTVILGILGLAIALVIAIPLGVFAAVNRGGWIDRAILLFSLLGQAMPTFWLCFLMILFFGIDLRWLPISAGTGPLNFVMPAMVLSFYAMPSFLRITRTGMIDTLQADYIRTARAKGIGPVAILFKHALRNALVPVVSVAAVQLGFMLGGSVVIENIFALHGVGYLAWEAISQNDYPVVQAIVLVVASAYVLLTLCADLLNGLVDPRIRVA